MTDWVKITNNHLTAEINPFGAELSRLTGSDGAEYLWGGDPAYWGKRAPILFPIVGRTPNDHISLPQGRFPMEKHGFARQSEFAVIERSATACTFELTPNETIRAMWLFEFSLKLTYRLSNNTLEQTATVTNLSPEPMPFNFGFHPAFNWPIPNSAGDHSLQRDEQDDPALYRIVDGALSLAPLPSPFHDGCLTLSPDHFKDDAMIFLDAAGNGLTFSAQTGPKIHCRFENLPDLGLWTAPNAPFLCIEPWHGADAIEGRGDALSDRHNVCLLEQGETADFTYAITIEE